MTISDERLAELIEDQLAEAHMYPGDPCAPDTAIALRELQQLRTCHREVICRRCGLRDQLGEVANADF